MPIKPENRDRYPANWAGIRAAILKRAGNKCERCGLANYAEVQRGQGKDAAIVWIPAEGFRCAETGQPVPEPESFTAKAKFTRIVLTIAHLDHQPENCAKSNLRAWCQRCHLAHDKPHHQRTAATTRATKRKGDGQ